MKKKRDVFENFGTISLLKASEGGMSQSFALSMLKANNIPARRGYSIYVGHYGIEVPERFIKRAERLLF